MPPNILFLLWLAATLTVTASPDAARTLQNTPVTMPVIANDTGSGNPLDPGSVTIVAPSAQGTTMVNPDGTVTFTPAPGFTGTTEFSYRVCDTSTPPVCATAVVTVTVTASQVAGVGRRIRISITNEYEADLDFGFLGKGSRTGKDRAEGVLSPQGSDYVGSVKAVVESTQQLSGMTGNCGPARYEDSQKLKVTGRPADGFNSYVQSVSFTSGRPGSEYLVLEFVPETKTTQQDANRNPDGDTVVNCHTLIETEATITNMTTGWSDILFLPLNDSRWTMKDGGYIIALPASGVLEYTDTTIAAGATFPGPFKPRKSIWTIRVERLP